MEKRICTISVGDTAELQREILEKDVIQMAELSQDINPVHLDEEYARTTRFGRRIAHGLFCISMVSALLGNQLPGIGTIILSESMKFILPVYLGDMITAQVKVESIDRERQRVELSFSCKNQDNALVMSGSVKVMLSE